jgi:hypothetical protein
MTAAPADATTAAAPADATTAAAPAGATTAATPAGATTAAAPAGATTEAALADAATADTWPYVFLRPFSSFSYSIHFVFYKLRIPLLYNRNHSFYSIYQGLYNKFFFD